MGGLKMFSHIDPSKEGGSAVTSDTVNQSQSQTNIQSIHWDPSYIKSLPGKLKISAVVVNLVVAICASIPADVFEYWDLHISKWTQVVSFSGFFVSAILLSFYLFHVIEKFPNIPWILFEIAFCVAWSFFYLTCVIDLIVKGEKWGQIDYPAPPKDNFLTYGTSFFCFCGLLVYGIDAVLKFKRWKKWN